jgi:hypothetical protein
MKTFRHSGDLGDIIYSLPAIKELGGGILYLNTNKTTPKYPGTPTKFSEKGAEILKPLLLKQSYIQDVKLWDGENIDFDLPDKTEFNDRYQIEEQVNGQYHIHYRNLRLEFNNKGDML